MGFKPVRGIVTAFILFTLGCLSSCPLMPNGAGGAPGAAAWKPLRLGAGGWLTGIDIAADGTRVVRADTYGAYRWTGSEWKQLVTRTSMPAGANGVDDNYGVFEIRISALSPAPGVPHLLYMMYGGDVYRSDDLGDSWARTNFPHMTPWDIADANGEYRTMGQKLAIDPVNAEVVYAGVGNVGANTSLYVTTDGGDTWSQVPTNQVPPSVVNYDPYTGEPITTGGITGIAFDPASTSGDRTNVIYACSWGNGVYRSTDAGNSWSRTTLTGGPTEVHHGVVANGIYYAVDGDTDPASDNEPHYLWMFNGVSWSSSELPNADWHGIAVDPANSSRIVLGSTGGNLTESTNGGAHWGIVTVSQRVADDVPWLEWTREDWMSAGDFAFDPTASNKLYFAEGIGVWYMTDSLESSPVTWHSQSRGIEQLVANQVLVPPYPGSKPLVASWDRPVFYIENPDAFPFTHGPDNEVPIVHGWDIDYASDNPRYVAAIMEGFAQKSGYSIDGGRTWRPFAAYPDAPPGGCIAVSHADTSDPDHVVASIVWVPENNGAPFYSQDGGVTWAQASFPGAPTSGETGWGGAYYLDRQIVAADRVSAGVYYAYNYVVGLYRSTDYAATWELIRPGELQSWSGYHAKLRAVPGRAGELFFTTGQQGNAGDPNPASTPLLRSTNGGVDWSPVQNVLEVYDIGFGKAATDGGYPTVFIAGWVGGEWGIWYSTDECVSWEKAGDFPLGSLDQIRTVTGDPNIFGRVYIGFSGSGYAYRDTGG
jgi:hypothetical protein